MVRVENSISLSSAQAELMTATNCALSQMVRVDDSNKFRAVTIIHKKFYLRVTRSAQQCFHTILYFNTILLLLQFSQLRLHSVPAQRPPPVPRFRKRHLHTRLTHVHLGSASGMLFLSTHRASA